MKNTTIETIENLPSGVGRPLAIGIPADVDDLFDPTVSTDDLHQLAREYRALMAVLEAAERVASVKSMAVKNFLALDLSDAIAEARRVIGEIEEIEAEQIADHCRRNNITHHSINADGSCNMGCC